MKKIVTAPNETMDFTEALKKAIDLGVTKDEFLHAWEMETKLKFKNDVGDVYDYSSQFSRNKFNEDSEPRVDQTSHFWHQAQEQLKQDFFMQLELLFSQQMEKHHLQWELMHSKNNQMAEESLRYFEILSQLIRNTVEAQGNALKLHLIQEFDLLRQNFAQMIQEHNATHTSGPNVSVSSHDQIQSASVQQNQFEFGNFNDGFKDPEVMPKQEYIQVQMSPNIHQFENNEDGLQSASSYNRCLDDPKETSVIVDGLERNSGDYDRPGPEIHSKKPDSCDREYSKSVHLKNATSTHNHSSPKQTSVEATGFYADAISSQMRQNNSPESSQSSSSRKTNDPPQINVKDREALNSIIYASVHSSSKSSWHKSFEKFTITNVDTFIISGKPFLSPFIHSHTKSWKAKLSVSFNMARQLKVLVLVSKGENDSHQEWPIQFSGTGYIFHIASKEITKVWELRMVMCQRPSVTRETGFPTDVCLSTARGRYPDVTYDQLELRKYTTNNQITFHWNIKALKRSTET